jgi:hypothetical protein
MSEGNSKLRIKLGAGELEFEGSEQFLKDEIIPMVKEVVLAGVGGDLQTPPTIDAKGTLIQLPPKAMADVSLSTSTVAAKLKATAASDLVMAAVAHLVLGQEKHRITRDEILTEMKSATFFYKSSMTNNMTNTLKQLVKAGRLNEAAADTYSLPHKEKVALEEKLAEAQ